MDVDEYNSQLLLNNEKLKGLLKAMFPDLQIPYEDIYQILIYLEQTQVNPEMLPRVIRAVHNITIGTGQGQVIIHVKEGMTNVDMREQSTNFVTKAKPEELSQP